MISHKDKLEALIGRAIEGGYFVPFGAKLKRFDDDEWLVFSSDHQKEYHEHVSAVIFNKDFNKALFGEGAKVPPGKERFAHQDFYVKNFPPGWQHHMQQAVISDNPIDYLYQAVFGEEK